MNREPPQYTYLKDMCIEVAHMLLEMFLIQGDFGSLPQKVQRFIAEKAELMQPSGIFICDGSQKEFQDIVDKLVERGVLTPLKAYEHKYEFLTFDLLDLRYRLSVHLNTVLLFF